MKYTPDDYGLRCQFDAFCKTVLKNEAKSYHKEMKCQRDRETLFEALLPSELDKLCIADQYPSDSFVFSAYGYELRIDDELVAAAFTELLQPGQSILMSCSYAFRTALWRQWYKDTATPATMPEKP